MLQDYIRLAIVNLQNAKEQLAKSAVPSPPAILEEQKAELIKDLELLAVTLKEGNELIMTSLEQV